MTPDNAPAHDDAPSLIESRKADHIRINLEEQVAFPSATTGFERIRFVHDALPELDLDSIDLGTTFLGHRLRSPFLFSSMIGGTPQAHTLLRTLATVAERAGCAIGVGSQRAAIEKADLAPLFTLRDIAPTTQVFANLGAVQLNYGIDVEGCRRLVEMVGADALILHLNPLQEAVQEEGDRDFRGLLAKIGRVCREVGVPVIVKEVGAGISADVARRLVDAGVSAIDVSGAGGTSWSAVESYRATSWLVKELGRSFADWGIPTATCLRMVRAELPDIPLIASGGLQSGIDAAKAIALGADLAGFAGPLLRAAAAGEERLEETVSLFTAQLRLVMFTTGSATLGDLRKAPLLES